MTISSTSTTTSSTSTTTTTTTSTTSLTSTTSTSTTTSPREYFFPCNCDFSLVYLGPVSLISANEDVYGIWNTTAGGDSTAATNGSSPGKYPSGEAPKMAVDNRTDTKYLSFGTCCGGDTKTTYCGLNTGFYFTPKYGSFWVIGLQFCTANDHNERDPTMATLEGSNQSNSSLTSGSSWTLIYNGTLGLNTDPGRQQCGQIQTISNTVRYTSYRILVTDKRAESDAVQYSEVCLKGY